MNEEMQPNLASRTRQRLPQVLAWGTVLCLGGFFITDAAVNTLRRQMLQKNFDTVRPGILYRSGQMSPEHFETALREHGIKTVVCLNPEAGNRWEVDAASRAGVGIRCFQMPGTGLGDVDEFRRVLKIIRDPEQQPVLVHCYAGAKRTGASVALYRILDEGWTFSDAVREMVRTGFDGSKDLIVHLRAMVDTFQAEERTLRLSREGNNGRRFPR